MSEKFNKVCALLNGDSITSQIKAGEKLSDGLNWEDENGFRVEVDSIGELSCIQVYDARGMMIDINESDAFNQNLSEFTSGYLTAALDLAIDDCCFGIAIFELPDKIKATAWADCKYFFDRYGKDVSNLKDGYTWKSAGVDFFLTRNGHGSGFWDMGLGQSGEELSALAREFGACDIDVGDDGGLFLFPADSFESRLSASAALSHNFCG